MSVLINYRPTEEFNSNRGLRQGDPKSPLLFNIMEEILHFLLCKADNLGIIQGIKLGDCSNLTHYQFTDDTIIFLDNSRTSCKGMKLILMLFKIIPRLKINYSKSRLFFWNQNMDIVKLCANQISFMVVKWLLSYLNALIGELKKSKMLWTPQVKKVQTNLSKWKCVTLNNLEDRC